MLVQGGPDHSGRKRALREKPREDWKCSCGERHKPYVARCPNPECRDKRP